MAADSCEEGNEKISPPVADGSYNLPVESSCFQLLKPSFDKVNQQCSLDVLPIRLKKTASFPVEKKCNFLSSHGQDVYSISMLPKECNMNPQCASQLAFVGYVELPVSPKKQVCLDPQLKCQKVIGLQMESADDYSPCIVDIDVEVENFEKPKINKENAGSIKSEGLVTGVLQRQSSLKANGRFMQLVANQSSTLLKLFSRDKSFSERANDTSTRRYKRAVSFDSRKIVLLFSILSSLGTLILIYLTLKVRQPADGFVNV